MKFFEICAEVLVPKFTRANFDYLVSKLINSHGKPFTVKRTFHSKLRDSSRNICKFNIN